MLGKNITVKEQVTYTDGKLESHFFSIVHGPNGYYHSSLRLTKKEAEELLKQLTEKLNEKK